MTFTPFYGRYRRALKRNTEVESELRLLRHRIALTTALLESTEDALARMDVAYADEMKKRRQLEEQLRFIVDRNLSAHERFET